MESLLPDCGSALGRRVLDHFGEMGLRRRPLWLPHDSPVLLRPQRLLPDGTGSGISAQKARRLPLGLLPAGLDLSGRGASRHPATQRPRPAGARAHRRAPNYVDEVKEIKEESGAVLVRKQTRAESVAEQRISHFLMALGIIGTMTGPLLTVLHLMPRAIFSGVFFIVGWGSIESNGIVKKILFLIREKRFQQPDDPLLKVRKRAICHFIGWQLLGWACTVAISQTIAAIGFPVLIVAFDPVAVESHAAS